MPLKTEDEEDEWLDEEEEEMPKEEKVVKREVPKTSKIAEKVVSKKPEVNSSEFELAQVPTQHTLAIRNKETGEVMSVEEGIVQILNVLSRIERAVG